MAELLATTPHATCPVLRSGTQKVSSQGCPSNPEVEDGTNRTGDTAQQPFLGETVEAPLGRTLSGPQAPMSAFLPLPPASYPSSCLTPPSASAQLTPRQAPPLQYPSGCHCPAHKGTPPLFSPCPCPTTATTVLFLLFLSLTTKATAGDPVIHSPALTPDSFHLLNQHLSELPFLSPRPRPFPQAALESHQIPSNPPNSNSCFLLLFVSQAASHYTVYRAGCPPSPSTTSNPIQSNPIHAPVHQFCLQNIVNFHLFCISTATAPVQATTILVEILTAS